MEIENNNFDTKGKWIVLYVLSWLSLRYILIIDDGVLFILCILLLLLPVIYHVFLSLIFIWDKDLRKKNLDYILFLHHLKKRHHKLACFGYYLFYFSAITPQILALSWRSDQTGSGYLNLIWTDCIWLYKESATYLGL